ncbi:MAG TPA: hypothetical protein G4O02_06775 [Caldilineae bacterium]|nr:hypothetical protein [Caldilineae bacterium]
MRQELGVETKRQPQPLVAQLTHGPLIFPPRIPKLLAKPGLFPSEARELRKLAAKHGLRLRWERYDANEPWRGWYEVV